MSVVVIDVDNQYCDELNFSYQVVKEDNEKYRIWVSSGLLSGWYLGEGVDGAHEFETLSEAWEALDSELRAVDLV